MYIFWKNESREEKEGDSAALDHMQMVSVGHWGVRGRAGVFSTLQ